MSLGQQLTTKRETDLQTILKTSWRNLPDGTLKKLYGQIES
jgi:hypothetical protein